jgi:DNA polymerase-1
MSVDPGIGPHLAIVDGHAQFFRAYYAIRGGLSSPVTGEPTGMVFGFVSMLFSYVRAQRPTELVVVIDAAGDQETFRSELYPDYKAHRDPAPEDFGPQVERCLEALRLMGSPCSGSRASRPTTSSPRSSGAPTPPLPPRASAW